MKTKLTATISVAIALFALISCVTSDRAAQSASGNCIVKNGKVYDASGRPMPACAARFDGAMMTTISSGKLVPLKQDMIMSDGVKCLVDGTCIMQDGSKRMLKEGELMTTHGKILRIKRSGSG